MNLLFTREQLSAEGRAGLMELIAEIEKQEPPDRRQLRDLAVTFSAAEDPHRVAEGVVDARFWPSLRRLGVSRHPVDLVIAGYGATNYLFGSSWTSPPQDISPRDERAVERVMNGLVLVALGDYPFSSNAVDLLALLTWWKPRHVRERLSLPSGRRLARALDRAARTFLRDGEPIDDHHRRLFSEIVHSAYQVVQPPHTATSSSAPALRLARLVLMRHPDPVEERDDLFLVRRKKPVVEEIIRTLQSIALGREGTTDVLLRREAAALVIEAGPLVDERKKRKPLSSTLDTTRFVEKLEQNQDLFGDLVVLANEVARLQQRVPSGPSKQWRDNFLDLVSDRELVLLGVSLPEGTLRETLDALVPRGQVPRTVAWRRLTRQVAVPAVALIRVLLVTPFSARARWIVATFRAAGPEAVDAMAESLQAILEHPTALEVEIPAKRAAWSLGFVAPALAQGGGGFLGSRRESVLQTLAGVARDASAPHDVAADAAWALGDVMAASREGIHRDGSKTLTKLVTEGRRHVEEVAASSASPPALPANGSLLRATAALHSMAVQLHPIFADVVGDTYIALKAIRPHIEKDDAFKEGDGLVFRQHVSATFAMADWALRRLDADVALSH